MHPEAKAFVLGVITKARSLRPMSGKQMDSVQTRKTAAEIIKLYAELSDDAKRSLTVLFPEIANGIEGFFCTETQLLNRIFHANLKFRHGIPGTCK